MYVLQITVIGRVGRYFPKEPQTFMYNHRDSQESDIKWFLQEYMATISFYGATNY